MFFSGIELLCLCCRLCLPLLRKTTEVAVRAATCSRLSRCGTILLPVAAPAACGQPSADHGRCVRSTAGSAREQRFISRAFSSTAWQGAGPCGCEEVGASIVAVGPVPSTEPPDVVLPTWALKSLGSVLTRGPCRAADASVVRHAAFLRLCRVLAGFTCWRLARCLQPGAPLPPAPCCAVFCRWQKFSVA